MANKLRGKGADTNIALFMSLMNVSFQNECLVSVLNNMFVKIDVIIYKFLLAFPGLTVVGGLRFVYLSVGVSRSNHLNY